MGLIDAILRRSGQDQLENAEYFSAHATGRGGMRTFVDGRGTVF